MALTFLQTASDTVDRSTYTFSAQNLGTASADRYIIVTVHSRIAGTPGLVINSVTVGGVAATISKQATNAVVNSNIAGITIAAVPTGTTGDVVITFNNTVLRCAIGMWSVTGISSITAYDTDSSTATNPSVNLDINAGGFAIGAGSDTNAATWTGLTEQYDTTVETFLSYTGASDTFGSDQIGRTITIDYGGGTTEQIGVFASWSIGATTTSTSSTSSSSSTSSTSSSSSSSSSTSHSTSSSSSSSSTSTSTLPYRRNPEIAIQETNLVIGYN